MCIPVTAYQGERNESLFPNFSGRLAFSKPSRLKGKISFSHSQDQDFFTGFVRPLFASPPFPLSPGVLLRDLREFINLLNQTDHLPFGSDSYLEGRRFPPPPPHSTSNRYAHSKRGRLFSITFFPQSRRLVGRRKGPIWFPTPLKRQSSSPFFFFWSHPNAFFPLPAFFPPRLPW